MTTNQQLIDHLSQFPRDAVVVISMYSECDDLNLNDVVLIRSEDKRLIRRNGQYISWNPRYQDPNEGPPEFVTVVHFPGN